jgi:hypothetical protein
MFLGGAQHWWNYVNIVIRIFCSWILLMALFSLSIIYEALQKKLKEAILSKVASLSYAKPEICEP